MVWLTLLAALAWIGLMRFRGGFWRADQVLPAASPPETYPDVAVLIPARNEEETIGEAVAAHRRADYPGRVHIIVADDGSDDATAEKALAAEGEHPVTVVRVPPLPEGWSGKIWALNTAHEKAQEVMPDAGFVLLTDADIRSGPSLLKKLVAQAERQELELTSIMARLDDRGFWGGLLIPAFIFFFQKLYPFRLTNDPSCDVAGAAGGVILLRRAALEKIGGFGALRGALIDDCTLAALVKNTEPRGQIGLYLSSPFAEAESLRDNSSYGAIKTMVARSAYTQLRHSPLYLLGTLLGLLFLYLVPPLGVLLFPFHGSGGALVFGLLGWILMAVAYRPTARRYGRKKREALALPLAALLYGWFTFLSARRHWSGGGAEWKGRSYPARKPS